MASKFKVGDRKGERDTWYQRCVRAEKALQLAQADAARKGAK